jgi:hypothetical protein
MRAIIAEISFLVNINNIKKSKVIEMANKFINSKAARRIQSHADKSGRNQNFKARAQSSAAKNQNKK